MDLADFPYLKETVDRVRGDIGYGTLAKTTFQCWKELDVSCCKAIIGGQHFSFERISDVPNFKNDVHRLLKRNI
jgi:hypothetical protein